MQARVLKCFVAVTGASVVACSTPLTTLDDLIVRFEVSPGTVRSSDSFEARLVIANPTDRAITLSSGSSCVATLEALRDGQHVDLAGTAFGCFAVVSHFELRPHQQLERTFPLVALLQADQAPWNYVIHPPPGPYEVRARLQVGLPDRTAAFHVADADR